MVGGIEGFIVKDGKSAGCEGANQKGTKEAWSMSDSDGVYIIPGAGCIFQSFINNREDRFEMGAGGNFRDDTSIFGKNINLGNDDVAQNFSAIFYDRGGGFVAAGFNA